MKLLELYSLTSGLKINKPFVYKAFYPLPFQKYITIQGSSAQAAKCYTFWDDVLEIIAPTLKELGYKIVQLGGKEDEPLKGCLHLQGVTNEQQTAYLLSNSLLHLSNDSFTAHLAGAFDVPLVVIYGSTTVKNHSPYFFNKDKTVFLEADLKGNKPSFSKEEPVKMVDTIMPETIANAALSLLGKALDTRVSWRMGDFYPTHIVEYVPDHAIAPNYLAGGVINVRMDYHFNEENFVKAVYGRKCNIITDKPININLIRTFKKHINRLSLEVFPDTNPEYVKQVKSTGIELHLFTKEMDEAKLKELRLTHFQFDVTHEKVLTKDSLDFVAKVGYDTFYKTNKFLIAKDGIFLSRADWKSGKKVEGFDDNVRQIQDTPDFWEEADYFYIFNQIKTE